MFLWKFCDLNLDFKVLKGFTGQKVKNILNCHVTHDLTDMKFLKWLTSDLTSVSKFQYDWHLTWHQFQKLNMTWHLTWPKAQKTNMTSDLTWPNLTWQNHCPQPLELLAVYFPHRRFIHGFMSCLPLVQSWICVKRVWGLWHGKIFLLSICVFGI